jgi:hypothetical protein
MLDPGEWRRWLYSSIEFAPFSLSRCVMNTVQHVALYDKQIMLHFVRFFGRMR